MKYVLPLLLACLLFTGCAATGPSVCDGLTEKSYLCEAADKSGAKLEDIGNVLIVANAVAIGQGVYTKEQALKVMVDIRSRLDFPVSYLFIRSMVTDATSRYPGLFEVAAIYLAQFNSPRIMYGKDREILTSWLDQQIKLLQ